MYRRFPFEDLTRNMNRSSWREKPLYDPTRRNQPGSGAMSTGRAVTSVERQYDFTINLLTDDDKDVIIEFEKEVGYGAERFDLRCLRDGEDYEVRLRDVIDISTDPNHSEKWQATISCYGKRIEKMNVNNIAVEDLAADADITTRPIFTVPSNAFTISSIGILTHGAPAGVDDSNTVVITIKDDAGNTIVSKTYNTSTQPPDSDFEDLGTIAYASCDAAEHLTLTITQGTTANMPAFDIVIEWYYTY